MKIKPLLDKVVIEELAPETITKNGIVLPTSAQEKPQMALVIAVGEGGIIDGKTVNMQVKVNDTILYSQYAGTEFNFENKRYKILRQADIMAIIEK